MGTSDMAYAYCSTLTMSPSVTSMADGGRQFSRVRQRPQRTGATTITPPLQPPRPLPVQLGSLQTSAPIARAPKDTESYMESTGDGSHLRSHRYLKGRGVHSSRRDERVPYGGSGVGGMSASEARRAIVEARHRRKWTEVLDVLDQWEMSTDKLDAKTYNVALSALSKAGRWQEATATLDRMQLNGVPPDVYSINGAISACGRAGKWQRALDLLAEMDEDGTQIGPNVSSYNGAINALAKANGRWKQALQLLAKMETRGLTPDVVTYTSVMCACERAGEWQRALGIMDLMREQNVVPNVVSYGTAVSACAKSGNWQKAVSLLEEMPSKGLVPNAVVYGSTVHACVLGGQRRRALALLNEMIGRGVAPDAKVFTAGMRAVDGWAEVLRLLEAMKRHGVMPDLVAYNVALSVIARSGREDIALAILEQIKRDGLSPNLISFNTAIDACATSENWVEAIKLLEFDMVCEKIQPDVVTFTSVIHSCSGPKGSWEKAYEILDRMYQTENGARPNKNTYDLVIQACGHGGEWELALTLLDDMVDVGIKLDTQTFNMAITACARSGQWLAAQTLVASMPQRGVAPDGFTYASLVAAYSRAGEWKQAKEAFDRARYVHRLKPSLQIYGSLLSCLVAFQQWTDVLLYLDRMAADGVALDAAATVCGVTAAAQLGHGLRALSLLNGEKLVGKRDAAGERSTEHLALPVSDEESEQQRSGAEDIHASEDCRKVKHVGTEAHDPGESYSIKSMIASGGWKAVTPAVLCTLLHALHGEKQDAVVLKTVRRAREEGIVLNSSVYRCALKACGNLGDCSQASALLSQMQGEELTADIIHWNHALRATTPNAQWRQADSYLKMMKAADVDPDQFSYIMALKACSAGLWSGNYWNKVGGWETEDGFFAASPLNPCAFDEEQDSKRDVERDVFSCRGRHALKLLKDMDASGIELCDRSLSLAMAACLEGHRDSRRLELLLSPPESERLLSEAALSVFDRLLTITATPSTTSYALALKACARTANACRASSILFSMLDDAHNYASEPNARFPSSDVRHPDATDSHGERPTPEVRPWHLASAIAAYDAAGDCVGAMRLWEEVLSRRVVPRSPGYGAAISAVARAGDLKAAFRLKDEATARKQILEKRAFRLLVEACKSQGEDALGAALLEDVRSGRLVVR